MSKWIGEFMCRWVVFCLNGKMFNGWIGKTVDRWMDGCVDEGMNGFLVR
jgi:hypothetical protein